VVVSGRRAELARLYQRAFDEFGTAALWNMRPVERPTRSPGSHETAGVAINRDGPRLSADIDIFQDGDESLAAIADVEAATIAGAGFALTWRGGGATEKRAAPVAKAGEQTQLEWVADRRRNARARCERRRPGLAPQPTPGTTFT